MRSPDTQTHRTLFGDFQTPDPLVRAVVGWLAACGYSPATVVEPTCGTGTFLRAAVDAFPGARHVLAIEREERYAGAARAAVGVPLPRHVEIRTADFFRQDWPREAALAPEPVLVVGNPPWVTAAALGTLGGRHLAPRSNFKGDRGLDALTGKANFDVAELMLIRLLEGFRNREVTLAMLVKTGTARRVLEWAWRTGYPLADAGLYEIDAMRTFGAAASAALLHLRGRPGQVPLTHCRVATLDEPEQVRAVLGWRDGALARDVFAYDAAVRFLRRPGSTRPPRWRSGIKHDCAPVMELHEADGECPRNGFDEVVDIEPDFTFPLLKGADIAAGHLAPCRSVIITPPEDDDAPGLRDRAPRTWAYLCRHADLLDRRRSTVYRRRPRFSVFGVGPYTFAPWKVAVSALHKQPRFVTIGPSRGRPVVVDDTTNILPFEGETAARATTDLLNSPEAAAAIGALAFLDAKRPITIGVLQRIDLEAIAEARGTRGQE